MSGQTDYNSRKVYLMACTSSLGSLAWGYNVSVFNALRVFLQENVFPDASEQSITLMASILTIGAACGSFFAGNLTNAYGRRRVLVYNDMLGIIGSCLCMIQSLPFVILGRLVAGINIGIHTVTVSLYNVEMAPTQIKGSMGTLSMAFMAFGGLVAFGANFLVPDIVTGRESQIWRLIFAFGIVLHVIRLAIFRFIFTFETPFYLVLKDKIEEAETSLGQIYHQNIDQHLKRVEKDKEASLSNGNLTFIDLFSDKYRKATLMVGLLAVGNQVCGFSPVFMFYNVLIQESANNNVETISLFATLMGVLSFTFTIVTVFITERYGRKPLLMIGMFVMFLIEALFALIGFSFGSDSSSLKYILLFWPIFYRISVGSLCFPYAAEVLPAIGVSFSVVTNWVVAFAIVQSFLPLVEMIQVEGVMLFLALSCLTSSILYKYYLVESKGRTKAELIELYNDSRNRDIANQDMYEMSRIPLIKN